MTKTFIGLIKTSLCLVLSIQIALPTWALGEDPLINLGPKIKDQDLAAIGFSQSDITLWVVSIGVSQYKNPKINLEYADNDAQTIAQWMETQEGRLFKEVNTLVLINEAANRKNILASIGPFLGQADKSDVMLIFIAGHGVKDTDGHYYFVPHNATGNHIESEGMAADEFIRAIGRARRQTDISKLLLWSDTCYAGAFDLSEVSAKGRRALEEDNKNTADLAYEIYDGLADELAKAEGYYLLSGAKATEQAREDVQFKFDDEQRAHGAFTYALLEGLKGKAADENGLVKINKLFSWVNERVPRLTGGMQHPWQQMEGTDLPLFITEESVFLNTPPIAHAGEDQIVNIGELVTLDGNTSEDPDGDVLEFSWKQLAGPEVALLNPNSPTSTFLPDKEEVYKFSLTVSDGKEVSKIDEVVIQSTHRLNSSTDAAKLSSPPLTELEKPLVDLQDQTAKERAEENGGRSNAPEESGTTLAYASKRDNEKTKPQNETIQKNQHKASNKRWWWILGASALGAAGALVVGTRGGSTPDTGEIEYEIPVPEEP